MSAGDAARAGTADVARRVREAMKTLPSAPSLPSVDAPMRVLRAVRGDEIVRAAPILARLGARALFRAARLTVDGAFLLGGIALDGAFSGKSIVAIVDEVTNETRRFVLDALGEPDPVRASRPIEARVVDEGRPPPVRSLEEQVADLLEVSNEVSSQASTHPAYLRVADELAPDEARILRLVAEQGPQPAVDVRTRRPFGVGSTLVQARMTMIGRLAGCADLSQVPAYLDNLERLGLMAYSPEPVDDPNGYQVLEVQPEVTEALGRAGRGTTVRRRLELTAFGRNFCESSGLAPAAAGS
jgi:hypothetical protein